MSARTPGLAFWQRWRRWLFGGEASLRESIEDVLDETETNGAQDFSSEERHMLRNLLGFRDVRVDDVMVPLADIEAVENAITTIDLLAQFADCGHSRMPVYRDTLDHPLGMVHVKDILSALHHAGDTDLDLAALTRPVLFVPPSMPALDLLLKMQATRSHMALVIDEHGGTDGLATIEDLIEEIIGEIEDEHDEDSTGLLRETAPGRWRAQARLPVDELEAALDMSFSQAAAPEDIDTLGGLVVAIAGRVPERGEMIGHNFDDGRGVEFVIRDGDPRRVKTIDIKTRSGKRA